VAGGDPSSRQLIADGPKADSTLPAVQRLVAALGISLLLAGCRGEPDTSPRTPLVVVGIDGADWAVIRALWQQGELPNIRRLAEQGVSAPLGTAYGKSPVIWTTIATGRTPREHGITGFVVPGPEGDVPVSSTVRRVPALWNIAGEAGIRTAVLGWWASWPAEPIRGVVISDRALIEPDRAVSPDDFAQRFERMREAARATPTGFGGNPAARDRDQLMAWAARDLADEGFDLLLVYFRGVDIASHFSWKAWEPEAFPDVDPEWVAAHADDIPSVYRATDAAIGEILAAAPAANVFVVSDHGFHAVREEIRVVLDLDRVLVSLGLLVRTADGGVDRRRSAAWSQGSAPAEDPKLLALRPDLEASERREVTTSLARVRYASGQPVFRLRPPRPGEAARGADLVAKMLTDGATTQLVHGDRPLGALVAQINRLTGSHGAHTSGVFVAHGPDIDPTADVEGLRIHDLAPTLLYALGLPVAEDMAGTARVALFTSRFQQRHPLHTVPSWGSSTPGEVTTSTVDEELVDELRTLGYLD
jgi:predicted AlkP superfamily phosphohydrolase/phosphomutase